MGSVKKDRNILVVSSGTAGHILPSREIIQELLNQGCKVVWLGYGYDLEKTISHPLLNHFVLRTKSPRRLTRLLQYDFFLDIVKDCSDIFRLFNNNKFQFTLITGGFVGFFPALIALFYRNPLYIYEQNVVLGACNAFFARFAQKIFFGLNPIALPINGLYVGQPLRSSITKAAIENKISQQFRENLIDSAESKTLLILGGSLGAEFFNTELVDILITLEEIKGFQVVHLAGKQGNLKDLSQKYQAAGIHANVLPFVEDIASYYAAASHIISRAGALSLSEVLLFHKPTLVVPLPNSAGDHQKKNAIKVQESYPIIVHEQKDLFKEHLVNFLNQPCHNHSLQQEVVLHNPVYQILSTCLDG